MLLKSVFTYKIPVHIAGWTIFFIVPFLISPVHEFAANLREPSNLLSIAIRNFLWMGLFYLNLLYFTPKLLKNKGVGIFIATLLPIAVTITLANFQIHHYFSHFPDGPPPDYFREGSPPPPPLGFGESGPLFSNFVVSIMIISVSTSLVLWSDWIRARAEEQERAYQKVASELAVLKLQISPHFLFNTLNNIRWLIRSRSDQAEAVMVKLSQLLRYILYQSTLEKVALEKEIENMRDYIDLQKIRLENTQSLVFSCEGDTQNKMIVPLLLIPLVENVFKYGEFHRSFQNQIQLKIEDDFLTFRTVNWASEKAGKKRANEYGIGLSNVKRRLALHYPGKHVLTFSEDHEIFKLDLEIILA
jgi:hypothetical protein